VDLPVLPETLIRRKTMRMARIGGFGILVLALGAAADPPTGDVAAKAVRYPDLGKAMRAHRGKVVVVDFWANW
jgi:hypothetical protein